MAWPMVGGIAATMAFNIVDTYFIGQLGAPELAAMGFINPVVMGIVSASIGISMGTSSVLSRALGEGEPSFIRTIASNSLILSGLISLLLTLVGWTWNDEIFALLGANAADLIFIREYMDIWWPCVFLVIVPMVAMGQIRAMGRTGLQSRIMIYASILNAILDPILIMGFAFIPAMGLEGAALATVLTRATTFFAGLYYLRYEFDLLYFSVELIQKFATSCKAIMHVAIPATVTNLITPAATGIVTAMVATYGTNAVAAFNIAINVEATCRITYFALAAAFAPLMGQNIGAKKYGRLASASRYAFKFCLAWGLLLAAIIAPFAPMIAGFFNETPEVIEIAANYMYIVPISYGCFGLMRTITAGLNGMGKPLPGTSISFTRVAIIQIPLALYAGPIWGLNGIWAAIAISNILAAITAYGWNKRIIAKLGPAPAAPPTS